MSEFTPTPNIATIRVLYALRRINADGVAPSVAEAEFDRALAAHDRAVKAEALREAADLRHGADLTPTTMGNPDPLWWYGYLQRVDESWRHQLRARADQIEGATE